ncbi:MAG: hypothetical protein AB7P24_16870 [Nitrospira sp.]|nr:hypothetical protein [bacterium]
MRRVDFYFHDGCLSQPSLLSLAKDIEAAYPTWTVTIHPLSADEVNAMGFTILPTITINNVPTAFGTPCREWLLEAIRMCE